mmetsp:Transcript_39088/g.90543  ORF Transcript_39088/g.90543 Transcript_39088/m.90543 type:complete len:208 (+) Transcript_39088:109-732(+)
MCPRSDEVMEEERRARKRERTKKRRAAGSLAPGTELAGVVVKRLPYGVLVDVGASVPGILHVNTLPGGRAYLPGLQLGDEVRVRVLEAARGLPGESGEPAARDTLTLALTVGGVVLSGGGEGGGGGAGAPAAVAQTGWQPMGAIKAAAAAAAAAALKVAPKAQPIPAAQPAAKHAGPKAAAARATTPAQRWAEEEEEEEEKERDQPR